MVASSPARSPNLSIAPSGRSVGILISSDAVFLLIFLLSSCSDSSNPYEARYGSLLVMKPGSTGHEWLALQMEDKDTAIEQATTDFAQIELLGQAIDDYYNPFGKNNSRNHTANFYDTARRIADSKHVPWIDPASRRKDDKTSFAVDDGGTTIAGKYYSSEQMESARSYGYDVVSGKPVDMTADDWDYLNRRLLLEGMENKRERHDAVRTIWRQERYNRQQLE